MPRHPPIPIVRLARLAVRGSKRARPWLGEALLLDALGRCLDLADRLGIHAVETDAIDEPAKSYYRKYGFVSLRDDEHHLYLPMASIRHAFRAS